jgi:hypothetical protein
LCLLYTLGRWLQWLYDHIASRAAFVVSNPDPPDVQQKFAASRNWRFPMVSHAETTFAADMGYRSVGGGWLPKVTTFRKNGARLTRISDRPCAPGDDFCALWHLFDLLPEGAADWVPRYQYS